MSRVWRRGARSDKRFPMPQPPPEEPWMRELLQSVYDTLILFAFGPEDVAASAIRNGTCCAVQVKNDAFLLTAAHVLTGALDMLRIARDTICVVGTYELELRGRTVYHDERLDLATIPLSRGEIERLEGDGRRIIRIEQWPPRCAERGDKIIFGGFPRTMRRIQSWDEGTFNAVVSAGAVTSVSSDGDWFTYHGDPADMTQTDVPAGKEEEDLLEQFGGVSGGPVFRSSGIPSGGLELVGIVSEGTPVCGHTVVRFARRLDAIHPSGPIGGACS